MLALNQALLCYASYRFPNSAKSLSGSLSVLPACGTDSLATYSRQLSLSSNVLHCILQSLSSPVRTRTPAVYQQLYQNSIRVISTAAYSRSVNRTSLKILADGKAIDNGECIHQLNNAITG